jgi:hypothetical protein
MKHQQVSRYWGYPKYLDISDNGKLSEVSEARIRPCLIGGSGAKESILLSPGKSALLTFHLEVLIEKVNKWGWIELKT